MVKVPVNLTFSEAKIAKHNGHVVLLSWDQFKNHPFMVHVLAVNTDSDSFRLWRKIAIVGSIQVDETPIALQNNSLKVIKEISIEV